DFFIAVVAGAVFLFMALNIGRSTPLFGSGVEHASFGSEGVARLELWKSAWLVIKSSPFIGYGAGPLAGISGPFGGSEAHNSLVDWAMATGLIGGVLLLSL